MDDDQTMRSMVRDDAYRVERVLADGPSGRTELVSLDGEGPLVRKRIPAALANAAAWAAAMELEEPLLPRIEELYRMPDQLVVVYEYVPGASVEELVATQGSLKPSQAVAVLRDVCHAVGALHARGVVHRDITPGNVIVAADGAHLVDLGIARQRSTTARRDTTTLGTWGFAAPEQYGFAQTDARSDVYSLGRLLGYMLTGVLPDAPSFDDALDDRLLVPASLARVVRTATAFEPSQRYQSAIQMADAAYDALTVREEPRAAEDAPSTRAREPRVDAAPKAPPYALSGRKEADAAAPRRFAQAPVLIKALVIAVWAVVVVFIAIIVLTTIDALTMEELGWGPAQYQMSVETIAGALAMAWHAYRLATLRGEYASTARPIRRFLGNCCKIVAIIFIAMLVSALVFPG